MFETYKGAQSAKKNAFSAFGGHSATRAKNRTSARRGKDTSGERCQTSSRPKLSQEFFSSGDNGKNLTT